MGALDNLTNFNNSDTYVHNSSVLSLDEYGSNEALAAVKLFNDYSDSLLIFASLCCGVFMLVGIPGNLITIIALSRCKKVRNATAIFIINLSCSDLLFCVFNLPLAASTFWNRSWLYGRFLCRMFPMTKYALVAVSLFTVLAITINRYIIIAWPTLYIKLYSKRNMALMIIFIWITCFGALIATWLEKWGMFSLDPIVGSCSIVPDTNNRSPKKFLFVGAFLIPGVAIIICYARIFWIVKKVAKKSRNTIKVRQNENIRRESILNYQNKTKVVQPKCHMQVYNCLAIPETSSVSGIDTVSDERDRQMPERDGFLTRSSEALQKLRLAITPAPKPKNPQLPSKKDKKLRTMIMAIMISFCCCHLPISVIKIFLEFSTHPIVNIASYVLLYLTTCINPIIYVVMSNEYRQAYKNIILRRGSDQDLADSTVLRRITSMKAIASVRQSLRKFNSVNTRIPT
ncbi:hypothetical protein ACJJTC_006270 [Scirpophaga incertulas]